MGKLFGTDGIRGKANEGNMTVEMIMRVGRATGYVMNQAYDNASEASPCILIGNDTRLSGGMLENALVSGICSAGVDVLCIGSIPTPALSYLTQKSPAVAGVMVSASHNPYSDNGIKIFLSDGYKLTNEMEAEIEELVLGESLDEAISDVEMVGRVRYMDKASDHYIEFCKKTVPEGCTFDGIKVVLDCSNGATSHCAPVIFSELGAEVSVIHTEPNGININDNCGSLHTQDLRFQVELNDAMAGLAFNGDGGRLIVVDEKGTELTGD